MSTHSECNGNQCLDCNGEGWDAGVAAAKAELATARETAQMRLRDINALESERLELIAERDAALAERDRLRAPVEQLNNGLLVRIETLQRDLTAANKRADDAVAAEREACAKLVERVQGTVPATQIAIWSTLKDIVAAIRQRGEATK